MHRLLHTPHLNRSTLRRAAAIVVLLALAALIAAGCGGADGDTSDVTSEAGPLSWLPPDTWIVLTANTSAKDIDTALTTLGRLPAWSLVESLLPAEDGAGLRLALFEWVARNTDGKAEPKAAAKTFEAGFGDRFGAAITSTKLGALTEGERADTPIAAWYEVDDEDKALATLKGIISGKIVEKEYEGETWYDAAEAGFAFTISDGLLVMSTAPERLKALIDVHEGDDSLADDETGRAVIESGIGDAFVGVALQTDPALQAIPRALESSAKGTKDEAKVAKVTKELDDVLESDAVDGLVADWISTSATIDDTGLRFRGSWSNPRDLAEPDLGSRELVERMPADAASVSAMVSSGDQLARAQDAWAEVAKAYDLDLRELADDCDPQFGWACDLGAEFAIAVLEDDDLADAMQDAAPSTSAVVQDLGASLAATMSAATGAPTKAPAQRVVEVATSADEHVEFHPTPELAKAATTAGLVVTANDDQTKVTVRVRPGSPIAQALAQLPKESGAAFGAYGLTPSKLLTPAGITLETEEVDGIRVSGLPNDAPSKVVPALEGDADTLGDAQTYREVVDAAKPPKRVGAYGWLDVQAYVDAVLTTLGASDPSVKRIIPTVQNNLDDAPGIVFWSTRDKVDGEQVGIYEMAMPILE